MLDAEQTLNTAKQIAYEAKVAYEMSRYLYGSSHEETLALKPAMDNTAAAQEEAQVAYNDAKFAFDTAVASDPTLSALYAELVVDNTAKNNIVNNTPEKNDGTFVSKATIHAAADTSWTRVENYNKWASLYEAFMTAYEKTANVALWTDEMAEAGDFSESPLYKAFKDIPAQIDGKDNLALPTFTYYFDASTQAYTIFVTSATQPNTVTQFDQYTTNNNSKVTGQNWLISPTAN
jgi:hypothetical protein